MPYTSEFPRVHEGKNIRVLRLCEGSSGDDWRHCLLCLVPKVMVVKYMLHLNCYDRAHAPLVRLLALLTGVLYVRLICSRLFLKFCLGKMAECIQFQDYLQAGMHDSVREGTPAASLAKAKMRLTKSLRQLGDSRSEWLQTFASGPGYGGTEEALIKSLIGYTLTEQVQINMTTGAFEKIRVQPDTVNKASDPALLSLLDGQAALIKSLTGKVNSLSEAPTRSEKFVPPLCLKELHELALVWYHPQWVTRVVYYLKCRTP